MDDHADVIMLEKLHARRSQVPTCTRDNEPSVIACDAECGVWQNVLDNAVKGQVHVSP